MANRDPIPTQFFTLVVVRLGDRFLLVQETNHEGTWSLPGGRLEVGEALVEGALRETLEESGVPVDLEGVIRLEHDASPSGHARVRVFFVARPRDDTPPKAAPDGHSLRAGWFTIADMSALDLRSPEVESICQHVLAGGPIYPLGLIASQGRI